MNLRTLWRVCLLSIAGCGGRVSYSGVDDVDGSGGSGDRGLTASGMAVSQATAPSDKLIFSSSKVYSAELGGLEGADAVCQVLAEAAGHKGTFRAWLSSSSSSVAERFTHSTERYVLGSGTIIADNWADLIVGRLKHAVDETESRTTAIPYVTQTCGRFAFWSGTSVRGDRLDWGSTCNDWTSASEDDRGEKGITAAYDWAWSQKCDGPCNGLAALLCVEQ